MRSETMKPETFRKFIFLSAIYLGGAVNPAFAVDETNLYVESQTMDKLAASRGESQVTSKISADFSGFAGSTANARSLVTGLRYAAPITLTAPQDGTPVTTTFTPPTHSLGHGNVFISLALAQRQLASQGIIRPTPEQIRAALMGGTLITGTDTAVKTVTLPGVLQMRSEGMGWGHIAKTLGMKLGPVVSEIKSVNRDLATRPFPHGAGASGSVVRAANDKAAGRAQGSRPVTMGIITK